jgi:integrase
MPTRRRLATGIYEDRYGRAVVYHAHGKPIETRFPIDKPLALLQRWRKTQIGQHAELHPRDPRGSLARDVVQYLQRLKGHAGYKSERSHLRAWLQVLPHHIRRWQITRAQVELAIADWLTAGYAARTIRHRCRGLESLYHRLDGAKADTPVDDVTLPAKPKPRPVAVPDVTIGAVALELRKHEIAGTLRTAKTRARFLLRATTGKRPIELMRALPIDVDLARRIWYPRTAKGGINTEVLLNDEQCAAWALFITAQAWGPYDTRSFSKTVQRCGWPKGIRPYQLRHSTARTLRARGGDPSDVQEMLGHTSIETGRAFYYAATPEQQAAISARLDDRFGAAVFAPLPRRPATKRKRRDAKGRDSLSNSEVA